MWANIKFHLTFFNFQFRAHEISVLESRKMPLGMIFTKVYSTLQKVQRNIMAAGILVLVVAAHEVLYFQWNANKTHNDIKNTSEHFLSFLDSESEDFHRNPKKSAASSAIIDAHSEQK